MKEFPEVVIGAFLSNYKIADIAEAAGLSKRAINRLKADPEFTAVLNERRSAIIGAAADQMTQSILQDADVLQKIINDPTVNAGIRVNAIQVKWGHLREWRAMLDFERRLRALESSGIAFIDAKSPGGGTG